LGLGIAQILSAFTDLFCNYKKVEFYWPHTLWIIFILFLQIQDWFILYQLGSWKVWILPIVIFILAYPVILFMCSKMLLPTNNLEESGDMKLFYFDQFPITFIILSIGTILSITFDVLLLKRSFYKQSVLFLFCSTIFVNRENKKRNCSQNSFNSNHCRVIDRANS